MTTRNFLGSAPTLTLLLLASLTATVSWVVPETAQAAKSEATTQQKKPVRKALTASEQRRVRTEEEARLKGKSYRTQAERLSRQYEATAKVIASQGGDPQLLLQAAQYFSSEARAARSNGGTINP